MSSCVAIFKTGCLENLFLLEGIAVVFGFVAYISRQLIEPVLFLGVGGGGG